MRESNLVDAGMMNQALNEKALALAQRRGPEPTLYVEAVRGGFIVVTPHPDFGGPIREVVQSPEALVATVQRWAKEATDR